MLLRSFLVLSIPLLVNTQCPSTPLQHDYPADIVLASGWNTSLVATNLTWPRGMVFDSEGNLLVVDKGVGLLAYKVVENENGGACLTEKKVMIGNEEFNHGIALSDDGKTLYVSTKNDVYTFPYDASTRANTSAGVSIITNMSNTGHITRTLYYYRNYLLVSAGSEGNLDPLATSPNSGHSVIKYFPLKNILSRKNPYNFKTEGSLLGSGLRNSVGVTVDPTTGGVWSVENSVDMLTRGGKEVWQDNPGEELNFLGWWNETIDNPGFMAPNYGYPSCVAVWDTQSLPDNGGINVGDQIVVEQLSTKNATSDADCKDKAKFISPRLTFQAHMAPLDIHFDYFPSTQGNPTSGGDGGLWVTFHGSWNRDVPAGYKLSKIPFDKGTGQPVAKPTDESNYEDVLWNRDTMKCKDGGCFRPVGVVVDAKGRVWVGSDSSGEIMVLWTAKGRGGGSEGGSGDNNTGDGGDGGDGGSGSGRAYGSVGAVGLLAGLVGVMLM